MRRTFVMVGAVACLLLLGASPTSGDSDRELKELAEKVSKLERQAKEFEQALARLERSVASLPKQTASANKDQARQVTDVERTVAVLEKAVATLDKASSQHGKTMAALTKDLKTMSERSEARDLLLADWFDAYHQQRSGSRYHHNQVEREK